MFMGAPARAYVHGGVGVSVAVLREALEAGHHLCERERERHTHTHTHTERERE